MIDGASTLEDVCFEVATALESAGIAGVLTGGSAAALYAPHAYVSHDADFILERDEVLSVIAEALKPTGFKREGRGRIFVHSATPFTIDFPKGPLAVGGEYLPQGQTALIERGAQKLRILTRLDCVRDRLSHFYHWDDYTALAAAVAVAVSWPLDLEAIKAWTERESPSLLIKFEEFERRVKARVRREPAKA